ncbi:hypothetical protein [Nannocystis pusilla]|uniref:Uncharacterized protein n=1 Tax=Nannocystis pusilla TaxID=889268 RepID=A0ABS7U4P5_9BACT|nr:hypothetical protein [Nannocystis pusilla]MBZ5715530.1 hypothetical protein [Nannocystis pusilla]
MNSSLVVLAAWWSVVLAPIEPVNPKVPPSGVESLDPRMPSVSESVGEQLTKLPRVTRAPKFSWQPGTYSLESLKLPDLIPIEKAGAWAPGPNWPYVEDGAVVVTEHPQDPHRFIAYLVDVKAQKIAAIREGDQAMHLSTIGHMRPGDFDKDGQSVPQSFSGLAGSGAVIILKPPVPPGPPGFPDDFKRRILDAGNIAYQASRAVNPVVKLGG